VYKADRSAGHLSEIAMPSRPHMPWGAHFKRDWLGEVHRLEGLVLALPEKAKDPSILASSRV